MRTKAQQLRSALQGITRLKRYLAVCHRDIDSLEQEVIHLRAAAREASFNKGRVVFLEAQIEAIAKESRDLLEALEQAAMDMEAFRLAMGAHDRAFFAPCVGRAKDVIARRRGN